MAKSLLNQFAQVRSSRTYDDGLLLAYAEQVGRQYLSTTIVTVSGSADITDASANSFAGWEKENFIVVDAGPAVGIYEITAVNGLAATVTPTPSVTISGASARRHYYQNLEDDLNYIRGQLKEITGEDGWKTLPETPLSAIDTVSGSLQIQIDNKATETVERHDLSAGDISSKYITLANVPTTEDKVIINIENGIIGTLNTDYTVSGTQINWNTKQWENELESGDTLVVLYWY